MKFLRHLGLRISNISRYCVIQPLLGESIRDNFEATKPFSFDLLIETLTKKTLKAWARFSKRRN